VQQVVVDPGDGQLTQAGEKIACTTVVQTLTYK
jgi:hypothetical protein